MDKRTIFKRLEEFRRLRAVRDYREVQEGKEFLVLAKDNISVEGVTTTADSKALKNLQLPKAFCVAWLNENGIEVFGITKMTSLAGFVSSNNQNKGYSEVGRYPSNPYVPIYYLGLAWNLAIAVVADMCLAALGTKTRGSISLPVLRMVFLRSNRREGPFSAPE